MLDPASLEAVLRNASKRSVGAFPGLAKIAAGQPIGIGRFDKDQCALFQDMHAVVISCWKGRCHEERLSIGGLSCPEVGTSRSKRDEKISRRTIRRACVGTHRN